MTGTNTNIQGAIALVLAMLIFSLQDIAAIRNSAPLMITLLSVVWLGEKVGPRRWIALFVGFMGVLLIVKPGATTFNLGSLFALLATLFYAINIMLTGKLQRTDSSATMAYYSSLVYLVLAFVSAPLAVLVGEIPDTHPSIAFLFYPGAMPALMDLVIMAGLGLVWAGGMYFVARAYSLARASVIAPFEHSLLLFNVMRGLVLWREIPTLTTLAGAALTLSSGLYIFYREQNKDRKPAFNRREQWNTLD